MSPANRNLNNWDDIYLYFKRIIAVNYMILQVLVFLGLEISDLRTRAANFLVLVL